MRKFGVTEVCSLMWNDSESYTETLMKALWSILLVLILSTAALGATPAKSNQSPPTRRLKIAIFVDPPYTIKMQDGKWAGFAVDVWGEIARTLRLDYDFQEMDVAEAITALSQNTVDLCISTLYFTPEREAAFDFSVPLGTGQEVLATRPEEIEHPWWSAIRLLLSWGTLKIVIILVCLVSLVGWIVWLVERKKNPEHFGGPVGRGIGAGAYWVGSTLASGVCFGIPLKSVIGRIIGLCWMFACTLALSALVASLASSFTLKQLAVKSVDVRELVPMRMGAVKGAVSEQFVKSLAGEFTVYASVEDALKALLDKQINGVAYDGATLRYYTRGKYRGKISLHPINLSTRLSFGFGIPTGSALRKAVNTTLLALMNGPLWNYWAELYNINEQTEEFKSPKRSRTDNAQTWRAPFC